MPLKSFEIRNIGPIRYAKCDQVPDIMIIAGPNGVEKSILLYALKEHAKTKQGVNISGDPRILYIGPYRTWRPTLIPISSLVGKEIRQRDILERDILESLRKIWNNKDNYNRESYAKLEFFLRIKEVDQPT